jgi:hypothetical protein
MGGGGVRRKRTSGVAAKGRDRAGGEEEEGQKGVEEGSVEEKRGSRGRRGRAGEGRRGRTGRGRRGRTGGGRRGRAGRGRRGRA